MKRYSVRARGQDDLSDIWRFSARQWNRAQADRYYRQIIDAFEAICARAFTKNIRL
ncbi:MAG TPA: hypothetical protein VG983_07520 [Caulobacterales bacterium]|jgi:plasmid stabilization system protein ParE|nr:hypothetical protein [Caulobacterales bacterium]